MGAVVKKLQQEPRKPFQIPSVEEVAQFIKEKKGWCDKFSRYYAERFWNFYQSNGWKVSGRAAMKDWQAAFNAQWQNLKYAEDIKYFSECQALKVVEMPQTQDYLNTLLLQYKKRFDSLSQETLIECYDYMKANGKITGRLTKEEIQTLKTCYSKDVNKGKAATVTMIFSKMVNYGYSF
jgi:hypothetical protein